MERNPNHRIPSHLLPEQEKRIIEPVPTALGRARTLTERKLTRDVAQIDQPTQRATQVGCRLAHAAADLAEAMAAGADQRQQGVGLDGAAHVVQEDAKWFPVQYAVAVQDQRGNSLSGRIVVRGEFPIAWHPAPDGIGNDATTVRAPPPGGQRATRRHRRPLSAPLPRPGRRGTGGHVHGFCPPRRQRGSLGSRSGAGGSERPVDARGPALAACSAPRYAAVVKIRHKGLRALHERDDPTHGCLQARCHDFAGYCSGSKKQSSRLTRPRRASGCIL